MTSTITDFKKTRIELIKTTNKRIYKKCGLWNEKQPCTRADALSLYLHGSYPAVDEYENYIVVSNYSAGDMF